MKEKNDKRQNKEKSSKSDLSESCTKCSNFEEKYEGDNKIIDVYYDIIKSEYNNSLRKIESTHSRSGFLTTVLIAMGAFFYNNEKFISIIKSINEALTIFTFIKYIICVLILVTYLIAILYLIKCISIRNTCKYNINNFDNNTLDEEKDKKLKEIINNYRKVINKFEEVHIKQARDYQKSLIFTFSTILLMIIFFII